VWQNLADHSDVLAIFQGPHAYISPSWYVTKKETGMVVPTWNYAVVHAHGRLEAIEDAAWLRDFLDKLTSSQESRKPDPWSVSDAPAQYVENLLGSIVGLKLTVTRLVGKWKLSQNRPADDRASVIKVLSEQNTESSLAMADWIGKANAESKQR
jgi:transcriptional regulator